MKTNAPHTVRGIDIATGMSGHGRVRVSLGSGRPGGVVRQRVNQQVWVTGTVVTDLAWQPNSTGHLRFHSFGDPAGHVDAGLMQDMRARRIGLTA